MIIKGFKYVITIYFSFFVIMSSAQWAIVHTDTSCSFFGLHFSDSLTGYVAGAQYDSLGVRSLIKKTTDGGSSWSILTLPTCANKRLLNITFTDTLSGIAVGYNGLILKTTDAGSSWECINSGIPYHLTSVDFPSVNIGYVVGGYKTILKTFNSGFNWQLIYTDTSNYLYSCTDVFFVNDTVGYVTGFNFVLKTTDGGLTWSTLDSSISFPSIFSFTPSSVFFVNTDTGYICNKNCIQISKTTDAGNTWYLYEDVDEYPYSGFTKLFFVNDTLGYSVGGYGYPTSGSIDQLIFMKTFDSGNSWYKDTSIYDIADRWNNTFTSIYFTNKDIGFLSTSNGIILRTTTGGGISNKPANLLPEKTIIYPNPVQNTLHISLNNNTLKEPSKMIITNLQGKIVHTQGIIHNENIDVSFLKDGMYFVKIFNNGLFLTASNYIVSTITKIESYNIHLLAQSLC